MQTKKEHVADEVPAWRRLPKSDVLRELGAGVTVACLALPLCVSAGVLAYSPLGAEQAAHGAVAGLLCAVAGGITAALSRQSSFIASNPTTTIGLVQASSVAALATNWHGDVAATIGVLPVLALLVGAWQIFFAATGLSRIIKFTPYPVLAGFVTGVGLLMMLKQLSILSGGRALNEVAIDYRRA